MKKIFIYIILLTSLIQFKYVDAQELDSVYLMSIEELLNLSVLSSNKKQELMNETPAAINVITEDEIKLLNFNTLQEVLEYSVGISSINGEGNIFTTTTIRGNTLVNYNTNSLLLIDGIPLYNSYHGSFNLNQIPLSSVKQIEIVKGSNSVLYGSNAMNAVINIITKKYNSVGNDKSNYSGKVKYGSFNTIYNSNSFSKKNDTWSIYFATDVISTDGEPLPLFDEMNDSLVLENNLKSFSSYAGISYKNIKVNFLYSGRELYNVRTRNFHRIYTDLADTIGRVIPENSDEDKLMVNAHYSFDLSEKMLLNLRSNYVKWGLRKNLYNGYWAYSSQGIYNDIDLKFSFSKRFSNLIGFSYNHFLGRRFKSQKSEYDIGKDKVWTNDFAVFLNGEYLLFKTLKLYYGGRYYRSMYANTILDNFSPRFALTHEPFKNVFIKVIYGNSFRIPTYFEKEVASHTVKGNPDLLPEKSKSLDFIISGIIPSFQFDVDIFYSNFNNRISRVRTEEDPNIYINSNVGNINIYGVEFNSKFRFAQKIFGFLGYANTVGIDNDLDKKLTYIYNNMINGGIQYKPVDFLSLNASYKYLDNWGEADAYSLLNLSLNIKCSKKIPLFIEIKADNILDTDVYLPEIARANESVPVIPKMLSRFFHIGLRYN